MSHVEEGADEKGSSASRPKVQIKAGIFFGYSYDSVRCEESAELQRSLVREIERSQRFQPAGDGEEPDLILEACLHEADDAANMEAALMISGLTVGLVPTWYSRELVLEVTARVEDSEERRYVETDSYTAINWLPLTPLALYWSSPRVFMQMAREQLRRVLAELETPPSTDDRLGSATR